MLTELAVGVGDGVAEGVGVGDGGLFGFGFGDGLDAPTPPQPATASTAAAAAMVIANFWRRRNAKVEKIWEVTRKVAMTAVFIGSSSSLANESPWGTGESFASNGAYSRGGQSEALLFGEMQQLWPEMPFAWWVT
jgi:hypothetical protein